jgi:hypothetical protein
MPSNEDTQPTKRPTPRPRKASPPAEHHPKHAAPEPEPGDPRIGQWVGERASFASFPDGAEYRVEDGKIVERVN